MILKNTKNLWIDIPGMISIFALRAARFNAKIPLTEKHVIVSLLAIQLSTVLRKIDGLSKLLTPGATATNTKVQTADNITNTSISNVFFVALIFFSSKKNRT